MTRRDRSSGRTPSPPETGRSSKETKFSTTSWMSEREPSGLPNGVWEACGCMVVLYRRGEAGPTLAPPRLGSRERPVEHRAEHAFQSRDRGGVGGIVRAMQAVIGAIDPLVAHVPPAGAELGEQPVGAHHRHGSVGRAVGEEHAGLGALEVLEAVAREEAAPPSMSMPEPVLVGALGIGEHRVPFLEHL